MPAWHMTVNLADVWRNQDMDFEQRRDEIVKRLREHGWMAYREEGDTLLWYVENLAKAEDKFEFDEWWSGVYDVADEDRVWIKTF